MHSVTVATAVTTTGSCIYVFEHRAQSTGGFDLVVPVADLAPFVRRFTDLTHDHNALPRPEQLDELERLACSGRIRSTPLEHARFGFRDAPRRPGYRAVRTR